MTKKKAKTILRRILDIIAILHEHSNGIRANEIHAKLVLKHETTVIATVYKDLNVLYDLGFLKKVRVQSTAGEDKLAYIYCLDVNRTKYLQQMAARI